MKFMFTFILVAHTVIRVTGLTASSPFLPGLRCTSEAVQVANSAQLYSILSELANSTFYRLVRIDKKEAGYCPIDSLMQDETTTCDSGGPSFSNDVFSHRSSLCSVEPEMPSPQVFASSVVSRISPEEFSAQLEFPHDNECAIEGTFAIRPDYWLDICGMNSGHYHHEEVEYINLRLNPERNTGYNGRVVWESMHSAIASLESFPEGRILKRLFSGYHATVTTEIMANFFPEGASWRPNFEKFNLVMKKEYLEDMQFGFVVLVRSLFKIKSFLYSYNFSTGNETEDLTTSSLMRHFLDSSVLTACESVTSGFDESEMFRLVVPATTESAVKFKKVFRKVSRMVNCVTCKRCKLHATVSLHGIGVALKILLTSGEAESLVTNSITRDDIVALVNTVEKFSHAIEQSKLLDRRVPTTNSDDKRKKMLEIVNSSKSFLTRREEDALVHAILKNDGNILVLGDVFQGHAFLRHALIYLELILPDAIVIGGGLAGLVTAISIAERGGSVTLLEKSKSLGGNSAKASSGINSIRSGDDMFLQDTLRSQNSKGDSQLAKILIENANSSISWLERTTGINLTSLAQLGGHSQARTWKPEHGVVGAEIMSALVGVIKRKFNPLIKIVTEFRVKSLLTENDQVIGVEDQEGHKTYARSVVIASGGFGFDASGLLKSYRPDLETFPTTLGSHTTGDGIRIALAVGAALRDMEYVQLHPTGFIDPNDRDNRVKVLAAEVLRGVGGIIVNKEGNRFVNELETRKTVTDAMLRENDKVFWLILSEDSAKKAANLVQIYVRRGLLKRCSFDELSPVIQNTVKNHFTKTDLFWYIGEVTPVVHYTMGGIKIDSAGKGLKTDGSAIPNLFAVGEVTGGVHGENRLGGNSLLECAVFGRIVGGSSVPISEHLTPSHFSPVTEIISAKASLKSFSIDNVQTHSTVDDCWTVIDNKVYDLSRYASDHPGGLEAISSSCGTDSTSRFLAAHSLNILSDMGFEPLGYINK